MDYRTKRGKQIKYWKAIIKSNWFGPMIFLAILLGIAIGGGIFHSQNPSPKPLSETFTTEVRADEPQPRPFCADVMKCFRDVGEELGVSNKDIMIAIRISKAECGMRPDAIGKNSNGTFDIGAMQINDVHNKRISRADRLDYEQNIRFAYKLRLEQGNWNAWSVCKNGKVDCR